MNHNPSSRPSILVVEDDTSFLDHLCAYLSEEYDCKSVQYAEEAVVKTGDADYDLILLDLDFGAGHMTGFDFLEEHLVDLPATPVVVVTRFKEMDNILRATRLGAYHYYIKDMDFRELDVIITRALEHRRLKKQLSDSSFDLGGRSEDQIIAMSPNFRKAIEDIRKVAETSAPVLLTGESGTGKTVLAQLIHQLSGRSGSCIEVNCAAIPDTLIEGELFGWEKDAHSTAHKRRRGMFELADGGTLFLDEIGEVDFGFQRSLLKAIDEKRFFSLGAERALTVDTRVIAATSQDLDSQVAAGKFKKELLYRLNAFEVQIPSLRERPEDIEALIDYYFEYHKKQHQKPVTGVTDRARQYLSMYEWPGNIRELSNALEAAVIRAGSGDVGICHIHLPSEQGMELLPYDEAKNLALATFQKKWLLRVLEIANGNLTEAAKLGGVARMTIHRLIREHGIEVVKNDATTK